MADNRRSVAELLAAAASMVVPVPDRQPWDYGWSVESYRRSNRAALSGSSGPVTMTSEGVAAFENAVTKLLNESKVRDRWDPEEFWGLVAATAVVPASELAEEDRLDYLNDEINFIRNSGKALTIQLVANVTWEHPPLLLGTAVIGNANDEFLDFVNASAHSRPQVEKELGERWVKNQVLSRETGDSPPPVAIACWTVGQQAKAFEETDRQLRNIVDLALLLERDLEAHGIYRRGDVNRPGIRGLTLDRGAIERGLKKSATVELSTSQLTITEVGDARSTHWFGAEPLPLGALLSQDYLRGAVQSCLKEDPISNRVRVAARWFAEAHYTLAADDAALALGVAMDAILTGKGNLPSSAMADRVAMLADDPAKRHKLVTDYLGFFGVRSSVAHSGRSSRLNNPDFIEEFRAFVHWIVWRSLALRDKFAISSETAVDDLYNDLRWGVQSWAT